MLLLTSTSDLLQIVTTAAIAVDVHASWIDNASGTITPGRTNTAITTVATTTVVGSPGVSTQRNIKTLHIRNKDTLTTTTVIVQHFDGTTTIDLFATQLTAGSMLEYVDGVGFQVLSGSTDVASPFQISGFTPANIAEVDTNTKALRVLRRARDQGFGNDLDHALSKFALGSSSISLNQTVAATAITSASVIQFFWPAAGGFALINRFEIAMATSALSGTRAGIVQARLRFMPIDLGGLNTSSWLNPPFGGNVQGTTGAQTMPLRMEPAQASPQLIIAIGSGNNALLSNNLEFAKDYGSASGRASATVGEQNIPPVTIFDAWQNHNYQPLLVAPNTGFSLDIDVPAAGTSQTVNLSFNMYWEEFIPYPPVGY